MALVLQSCLVESSWQKAPDLACTSKTAGSVCPQCKLVLSFEPLEWCLQGNQCYCADSIHIIGKADLGAPTRLGVFWFRLHDSDANYVQTQWLRQSVPKEVSVQPSFEPNHLAGCGNCPAGCGMDGRGSRCGQLRSGWRPELESVRWGTRPSTQLVSNIFLRGPAASIRLSCLQNSG